MIIDKILDTLGKFSPKIILVDDYAEGQQAHNLLDFLYTHRDISSSIFSTTIEARPILFPDIRLFYGDDLRAYTAELSALSAALRDYFASPSSTLIIPIKTAILPMPTEPLVGGFDISVGDSFDLFALRSQFLHAMYALVDEVSLSGETSFRNDILDICTDENSYRISFFDDIVEDIRFLDLSTQLSSGDLSTIRINPAPFNFNAIVSFDTLETSAQTFTNQLEPDISSTSLWLIDRLGLSFMILKSSILASSRALEAFTFLLSDPLFSHPHLDFLSSLSTALKSSLALDFSTTYAPISFTSRSHLLPVSASNIPEFIDLHLDDSIFLLSSSTSFLDGILAKYPAIKPITTPHPLNFTYKNHFFLSNNTALMQTLANHKHKKLKLKELKENELIVHEDYGIGRFMGIAQKSILGKVQDFLHIAYLGEDSLFLPIIHIGKLTPYDYNSVIPPKLDSLGKATFSKLKAKVRDKLLLIAHSIIALNAKRALNKGAILEIEDEKLRDFQSRTNFALTIDQATAIDEIRADLASSRIMDRLLCGDVGFGKTEVALNAIFIAAQNRAKSLFIVPTTLLSLQHYNSIAPRLEAFGFRAARIDRTIKPASAKASIEAFIDGEIDLLIGTHALFGIDFSSTTISLIILDEEHKFGVKQKEKIKELSANTHLLSMSATPIPRTLSLALCNIKSISNLYTPPSSRLGVQTRLLASNPLNIKEAITRELRRNGQIFYIYNHISKLEVIKSKLQSLIPTLKIEILHSQIPPKFSEQILLDFALGKFDLLLCTSIVESGLHLPNANTIIIDQPQNFGIADLHQLRGRVGRGSTLGLCYLLVDDELLQATDSTTTRRLLSLQEHSDLGSGTTLAHTDLELRGGGNLLGSEQSGHIKNIGVSLYMNMLEDTLNSLTTSASSSAKTSLDLRLSITAYLSPEFISSTSLRLEAYRTLSLCEDREELFAIESHLRDRFGALDTISSQFLELILIKILAPTQGIISITNYREDIKITYANGESKSLKAYDLDDHYILQAVLDFLNQNQRSDK